MSTEESRAKSAATKKARTHAKLLGAAQQILARDGWKGLKMANVAIEAGIAPATIYNYFSSKAELGAYLTSEGYADIDELTQLREMKARFLRLLAVTKGSSIPTTSVEYAFYGPEGYAERRVAEMGGPSAPAAV